MIVRSLAGRRVGISEVSDIFAQRYAAAPPNLSRCSRVGRALLTKAAEKKIVNPPYDMAKLCALLDVDEYHAGCVDAIVMSTIMQVQCTHSRVAAWLAAAQFPACEDESTVLAELLKFYLACGNGFLIKMRDAAGNWVGLERMLPSEVQIVENYDDYGFFVPNYIQVKNSTRRDYRYADVIHMKRSTHKSNAWGLACLPIALNLEILGEIKTYDYNNFANGLLIDYFLIVEGGSLRDGSAVNDAGEEVIADAFEQIQAALAEAKGNSRSHSSILIESESKDVKIRLEPLRANSPDGGFITLKKDLREGVFAYHRVPPRIVSQLVSGQLGGDTSSDMTLFYNFVIKPLQNRLALSLASEFNLENPGWGVRPGDFNFGDLTAALQSQDEILFAANRNL